MLMFDIKYLGNQFDNVRVLIILFEHSFSICSLKGRRANLSFCARWVAATIIYTLFFIRAYLSLVLREHFSNDSLCQLRTILLNLIQLYRVLTNRLTGSRLALCKGYTIWIKHTHIIIVFLMFHVLYIHLSWVIAIVCFCVHLTILFNFILVWSYNRLYYKRRRSLRSGQAYLICAVYVFSEVCCGKAFIEIDKWVLS